MNINLTLFLEMVIFAGFVLFTKKYVWEPIVGVLDARKAVIADGLAAAEKGIKDQELAESRAEDLIVGAKAEALEIVSQAKKRDSQMVQEAKDKAVEEADRVMAGAQAEIDQEVNRAKDSLRSKVSELAVAGASKILGKEVDAKTHKSALKDLIEQI